VLLAGTVVAALAACGGSHDSALPPATDQSWAAVEDRAEAEGTVVVYSVAVPAQNDPLVEAFQAKYPGVQVEMVRGASELTGRVDQEIASGTAGADVFLYAGQQWYLDNAEHLVEVDSPASEVWPEDGWAIPGTAPEVSLVPAGFITWNTDLFPDGFEDWDDVTDPDVQGKLGMRDTI